jgi:hypothetical protein
LTSPGVRRFTRNPPNSIGYLRRRKQTMDQRRIYPGGFAIVVALALMGCSRAPHVPEPTQTSSLLPQPVVSSTRPLAPTPTQTLVTPTPVPTQEPTIANCTNARFVWPQDGDTVAAGDISVHWEPPECMMVLQYYQHEKLIDEYFDVISRVTLSILESGPTELKIWVSGSSTPSDAIWITVK